MVKENRSKLHDKVSRALGILQSARTITSEETMHLLSILRLGINLGLIDGIEIPTINELFIHTQPAHLQKLSGAPMESSDRNAARASHIRLRLAPMEPPSEGE
jgi:protein arginine kinase